MSSGYDGERQAFETTFLIAWAAATLVKVENQPFVEPDDEAWVSLMIEPGPANHVGLGTNPHKEYPGIFVVAIRVPEATGSNDIREMDDTVLGIFQDVNGRPLDISAGNSGRIRTEIGYVMNDKIVEGWYQHRVIIPFTRDIVGTA